jgi:putative nucleotidyltransferase with HDIG domain
MAKRRGRRTAGTEVNYKKELESAAKSMILVHEPDTLIRMIVRRIVQKVQVSHAAILLQQKDRDTYVLSVSRGLTGLKVPAGFVRMDRDNPLINFFVQHKDDFVLHGGVLIYDRVKKIITRRIKSQPHRLLKRVLHQMDIFEAEVCIPSYFRDELLGVLFLGKKKNCKRFVRQELDFFVALASDVSMAMRNAQLFKELAQELDKNRRLFINTTIALAAAIEAKDNYTRGHTARVTNLSLEIAKKLNQKDNNALNEKFFDDLHIASLLHDIGKIGIPEHILNKEGPLSAEEKKRMEDHSVVGVNILQSIKELEDSMLGVKYHHERYDGSGYPEGLKGKQIPLIAAVIAVADAFDAMTTNRPYRRGLTKDEAVQEIMRTRGQQFDPEVVTAFLVLYEEGKI